MRARPPEGSGGAALPSPCLLLGVRSYTVLSTRILHHGCLEIVNVTIYVCMKRLTLEMSSFKIIHLPKLRTIDLFKNILFTLLRTNLVLVLVNDDLVRRIIIFFMDLVKIARIQTPRSFQF